MKIFLSLYYLGDGCHSPFLGRENIVKLQFFSIEGPYIILSAYLQIWYSNTTKRTLKGFSISLFSKICREPPRRQSTPTEIVLTSLAIRGPKLHLWFSLIPTRYILLHFIKTFSNLMIRWTLCFRKNFKDLTIYEFKQVEQMKLYDRI